jgi:tetratricopeptide (TPR) repeat protein
MEVKTFVRRRRTRVVAAAMLVALLVIGPIQSAAQDLVLVSSITGGSSVFVFRSAQRQVRRPLAPSRPTRSKVQRLEAVKKINRQYATVAKTQPKVNRARSLDPTKLPRNARTLPAAQGSKLFAGVGEWYLEKGDFARAIEVFNDAITLDENNKDARNGMSEALALKGNTLLEQDQAKAARAVFLEAIKYDPSNAAAYFGLGEVYADLEQIDEAISSYERSLEANKDLTEIYVPLGVLYFQKGNIAKADELLTKALAQSTESFERQFFFGLVRNSQERLDEALGAFAKAKTLDATSAEAAYYHAEVLSKLKRLEEAVPDYQKAVELKSSYFEAWLGLADALRELKRYPEAIEAYKRAAKLQNNNWEVFAGLAESYRLSESDFEQAEANYNLATLFMTRDKDVSKEQIADIYSKAAYSIGRQCPINAAKNLACKWASAIGFLEKAIELTGNPLDRANLGWAYYNFAREDLDRLRAADAKPKLEKAKENLSKALAEAPAIADAVRQNLGAVQIDLGDFQGAIASLTPVVEKQPDWNFSRYALGTAYFRVNDFENAAKAFRVAAEKDPTNVAILSSLGVSEMRRKNGKEVKKVIDKLKTLSPSEASKLEVQAKLAKVI